MGAHFPDVAVSASSTALTIRAQKGTRDDAEGQGCGDLRSRRRHRWRCRTRLCARGGQAVSHRAPPGTGRSGRQGHRFRWRIRRGGGGRRARRARCGQASGVRDRYGGPRRHLVQRGRDPGYEDSGCASGRAGCRAVLPADRDLHEIVLSDRAPGGPAHGPEQIGGDHDRHHTPLADGPPTGGRLRSGAGRQGGTHSRALRRARTSGHSRGRSATTGDAGIGRIKETLLRVSRQGIEHDLGTVPGAARKQDPRATAHDARGDG